MTLPTVNDIVSGIIDAAVKDVVSLSDATMAFAEIERDMIEAFGWRPIETADEYDLRCVPAGKKWGPRIVALVTGDNQQGPAPAIVYWDPDVVQPDGRPVANPTPYWRAVAMTAGWSRRNQPTHYIRPYR